MIYRLFHKPLFTGFSPNITFSQVRRALSFLVFPWLWPKLRSGRYIHDVELWLEDYFGPTHAITFDSGRSALYFGLKALGVGEGDEVLVQGYTCVVVTNAIRWTGAKPVYVDVGDDYNIDPDDLKKKITSHSKALIIQHTFGLTADLETLLPIARSHGIATIEDCAHSMGATYNGNPTGTYADIGMFSFGSDKVVSCARGGALITRDPHLAKKLRTLQTPLPAYPYPVLIQHLLHFPFFWFGRLFYFWGIGKMLLALSKRLHITNRIISFAEKKGEQTDYFPCKFPNALACIVLLQLKKMDQINEHRKKIATLYTQLFAEGLQKPFADKENCIFMRYPLVVEHPQKILRGMADVGVLLGDWYDTPIAPKDIAISHTGYTFGDCPKAEFFSKHTINLPTNRHIQEKDAKRIIILLKSVICKTTE